MTISLLTLLENPVLSLSNFQYFSIFKNFNILWDYWGDYSLKSPDICQIHCTHFSVSKIFWGVRGEPPLTITPLYVIQYGPPYQPGCPPSASKLATGLLGTLEFLPLCATPQECWPLVSNGI